ncbi:EI24 domain-containing protein [Rubrivivax gelatinosus]|uniref:Etoposide-induced protein 2.4 (EI24) n=1 Tax=Rubrivivax gelatinosus TaxID=28068 RepID=A0ABS1DPV9_RUBGE|nr:EI24 domain-containing protein [Rubrivivax gelatinosus]MBK1711503.1 hypothetical protein [Rubrivivax gelatinosus]
MTRLLDAFWRAAAYCLHPRVILWSLLPLLVAGGAAGLAGWMFWESGVAAVRATMEQWALVAMALRWLDSIGADGLHALLAPLVVVALAVPVLIVATLLLVALLVTPAVVDLVAGRRFPLLERRRGGRWWQGLAWSLWCTLVALLALVASIPLWFVPPLALLLPPLIWGWLTYRVYAFDVLAAHADADERRRILAEQRWPLMAMGVVCGYLGAAPTLLWAVSAATLILAPVLIVASVWLYTLVFAFASAWFAHFALDALDRLRRETGAAPAQPLPAEPSPPPPPPPPVTLDPLPPP